MSYRRTNRFSSTLFALVLAAAGATALSPPPQAQAPVRTPARAQAGVPAPAPTASLPNDKDSVKFLVIGDSGTGGRQQIETAKIIAAAHERFKFEFAIMLGDNLYGRESASAFVSKFERPYKPLLDAGVKFYASLGNHDEPSQRFYPLFNMDGKRYYSFRKGGGLPLIGGGADVEFFALDSTYMTPQQIDWLKDALARSDAKWKIPYFHHPIYSSGEKHGSELDLQLLVEPLFVQHGVDIVFSGHEHFYERLKPQKGVYYITQGGSAKLRAGNINKRSPLTAKGFDTDNSFTLVEILKDQMFFETISRRGQVVDSGVILRREVAAAVSSN